MYKYDSRLNDAALIVYYNYLRVPTPGQTLQRKCRREDAVTVVLRVAGVKRAVWNSFETQKRDL